MIIVFIGPGSVEGCRLIFHFFLSELFLITSEYSCDYMPDFGSLNLCKQHLTQAVEIRAEVLRLHLHRRGRLPGLTERSAVNSPGLTVKTWSLVGLRMRGSLDRVGGSEGIRSSSVYLLSSSR